MALNIWPGFQRNAEGKKIRRILDRLDKEKTPVRVEIEGANIHFRTIIAVKRGVVVVAKPMGLKGAIKRKQFVRLRVPYAEKGQEIRLQVSVSQFNMFNGSQAFLCEIPDSFAPSSMRDGDRYDTSRFGNLFLFIPSLEKQFRITDISHKGCKIYVGEEESTNSESKSDTRSPLDVGYQSRNAQIIVGRGVVIELEVLVMRGRYGAMAGFQFQPAQDGESHRLLSHLIKQLDVAQSARFQFPAGTLERVEREAKREMLGAR